MFERLPRRKSEAASLAIDPFDRVMIEGMLTMLPERDY